MKPRNDRALALSAFCLEIEKHRRTPEGRVRNAEQFLHYYFPRTGSGAAATVDRLFVHLPPEVRGPVIAGWRIRGLKAALRDDDERVKAVVLDALEAGDLDAPTFEGGLGPETVVDYVPLDEWWTFWRGAALPNAAVQKALATARAMHLVDDAWFLENVSGRGGKVRGTDAVCDTLSKDEITAWIKGVHASGDASPAGIVAARGWESILAKTAPEALLAALDAFAAKVHLVTSASVAPPNGGREPLDLSAIDPDAAPNGGWPDEERRTGNGELVDEGEIETLDTPHRPPPLPQ
ncbi:MAG: hypothetical protein JWP97_948 [Labilithrix sp.]|nr:hypothetical protein [Labilithrix sp.]